MLDAQTQSRKDVPWQVALAALGALIVLFYYAQSPKTFTVFFNELDRYGDTHLGFMSAILLAFTVNCISVYSLCAESLGINQQGKRLEILTGKKKKTSPPTNLPRILVVGIIFYAGFFFSFTEGWLDLLPRFLPQLWSKPIIILLSGNFGLCAGVMSSYLGRLESIPFFHRKKTDLLPVMPHPKNGIVLGTINEEIEYGLS